MRRRLGALVTRGIRQQIRVKNPLQRASMQLHPGISSLRMRPTLAPLLLLPLLLGIAACSTVNETASRLFSSDTHAAGVFAGRLLQGKANFTSAREASIQLQAVEPPTLGCLGTLRFTGTGGGIAGFTCSDGLTVSIPFQSLSALRGSGRVQVGESMFALTYGLTPEMAGAYLALPAARLVSPKAAAATSGPVP